MNEHQLETRKDGNLKSAKNLKKKALKFLHRINQH